MLRALEIYYKRIIVQFSPKMILIMMNLWLQDKAKLCPKAEGSLIKFPSKNNNTYWKITVFKCVTFDYTELNKTRTHHCCREVILYFLHMNNDRIIGFSILIMKIWYRDLEKSLYVWCGKKKKNLEKAKQDESYFE